MRVIRSVVRAVREEKEMSRATLAHRCEVKENTIRLLETPGGSYSGPTLFRACETLGIWLEPKKVRQ